MRSKKSATARATADLDLVQYVTLNAKSGKPVKVSVSDLTGLSEPYIAVYYLEAPGDLEVARELAKALPNSDYPTVAVVDPKIFNLPDYQFTVVEEYTAVLVEERQDFKVAQLENWFARLARPIMRRLARGPKDPGSEATLTNLSARLRDPAGRLDARKLSDLLGISMTDLATKVCGVTKQALSQTPASAGIQDKLQPLEDVAQLLHWCSGDEAKLRAWLKRPNPDFPDIDGKSPSPVDLILRGHANIVARKVHNLRTGHPA